MSHDIKNCPLCGALPCDWADDPHKLEVGLCWTLAKIREELGVYEKPMLDELPAIVREVVERASRAPALLEALDALAKCDFDEGDDPRTYNEVCRKARAAIARAKGGE